MEILAYRWHVYRKMRQNLDKWVMPWKIVCKIYLKMYCLCTNRLVFYFVFIDVFRSYFIYFTHSPMAFPWYFLWLSCGWGFSGISTCFAWSCPWIGFGFYPAHSLHRSLSFIRCVQRTFLILRILRINRSLSFYFIPRNRNFFCTKTERLQRNVRGTYLLCLVRPQNAQQRQHKNDKTMFNLCKM